MGKGVRFGYSTVSFRAPFLSFRQDWNNKKSPTIRWYCRTCLFFVAVWLCSYVIRLGSESYSQIAVYQSNIRNYLFNPPISPCDNFRIILGSNQQFCYFQPQRYNKKLGILKINVTKKSERTDNFSFSSLVTHRFVLVKELWWECFPIQKEKKIYPENNLKRSKIHWTTDTLLETDTYLLVIQWSGRSCDNPSFSNGMKIPILTFRLPLTMNPK